MPIKKTTFQLDFPLDLPEPEQVTPYEAKLRRAAAHQAFESAEEKPTWYEDYIFLRENGWPFRVAVYIAWASTPRSARWPKHLYELGDLLGVSWRQIHKWRRKNPAIDETVAAMQAEYLMRHRADVIASLIRNASDDDYKNIPAKRLFFQLTGDLGDGSDITLRTAPVTGDELAEARAKALEEEQARFGDLEDDDSAE